MTAVAKNSFVPASVQRATSNRLEAVAWGCCTHTEVRICHMVDEQYISVRVAMCICSYLGILGFGIQYFLSLFALPAQGLCRW